MTGIGLRSWKSGWRWPANRAARRGRAADCAGRARDARRPVPAGGQLRAGAGDDRAPARAARGRDALAHPPGGAREQGGGVPAGPGRCARRRWRTAASCWRREDAHRLRCRSAPGSTCSAPRRSSGWAARRRPRARRPRRSRSPTQSATSRSSARGAAPRSGGSPTAAGDLHAARDLYEQALGALPAARRRVGVPRALRNDLGLIHKNLCEWDAAVAHLRAALETFRAARPLRRRRPTPLLNLGIVYQKSGEWERAERVLRRRPSRSTSRLANPLRLARGARSARGNVARLQRRFADAEALLGDALRACARQLGAAREEVLALEFLGELDVRPRPARRGALARYDQALAAGRAASPPRATWWSSWSAAAPRRWRRLGRLDEAERACERALRLARAHRRPARARAWRTASAAAIAWAPRPSATTPCAAGRDAVAPAHRAAASATSWAARCSSWAAAAATRARRAATSTAPARCSPSCRPHDWLERTEQELQRRAGRGRRAAPPRGRLAARPPPPGARALVACSHAMQRVETLARRAAAHRSVGARSPARPGPARSWSRAPSTRSRRGRDRPVPGRELRRAARRAGAVAALRPPQGRLHRRARRGRRAGRGGRTAARCSSTRSASCRTTCR